MYSRNNVNYYLMNEIKNEVLEAIAEGFDSSVSKGAVLYVAHLVCTAL